MSSCVIKNKDFYSLAEEHGIDGSELELIVHKYWNEVGKEDSFPPSSYINEQLGIGKSYDEASENVRKLWERDYSRPIKLKSEFELNGAKEKAKTFFPVDVITTYKDSNSNYILRIAEPVTSSSIDKEIQDILAKAPRDSQGRLLAPNGKVSNLTEKQYAQVRTKAFKDWFGDWEKEYTPPIQYDLSTWERTGKYVDVLEKDFLGNNYSTSKEILSHPIERKEPTKEDPFGFNSAGVSKAIKIGTLVNRSNPLNGICQFTAQRIQAFLKDRYGINTYINIISAKSPVTGKLITHYVVVLSIDGKPYIYDMPQTEFITTNGNTFNVGNKEYKEAVITKEYTPRLIPITKESLLKNYGDSNDIQISVIENMAKLSDNIKSSDIETSYIPAYSPDVSKVVDENGEPLVTWHSTLAEIENNIFKDYENITISRNEEWVTNKNIYDYKKEGYIISNNDILEYNKGNKITIKRPNGIYSSSERDVSNTYTKKEYEAFDEYDQYTDWDADHKAEQWSLEEDALYDEFKKEVENNVPEEYKAYNIGIDAYKEYIIKETGKRVDEEMSKRHPEGKKEYITPTNPYNYSDDILGSEFALFNSIKNPLIVDANYSNWNEIEYNNEIHSTRSLEKYARDNGYDGIIVKNVYDVGSFARKEGIKSSTIIASFNSNQVKSATDNIGTFSTTDDNINHDTTTANVVSSSSISYIGQKEATTRVQSFIDSIDKSGEYGQAIQEFIDTFGLPVVNEVIFNITQANTHSSSWNNFTRALKLGFSEMASSEEKAAVTLHELIHSRTTSLANLYEKAHGVKSLKSKEKSKVFESLSSDALTPEIEKAFDNIVECKAEVLKYLEENPEIKETLLSTDVTTNLNKRPLYAILKETNKYGIKEFISEIYTNPAFIQLLKSIPTKVKKQSLWDKFVNALRSIFGKKKTYISVLDIARENADVIVRAGNNVTTAFETISEDASSLPIGQQRAQLRNYYSSLQTRSSQEFKQVKSLASQFFKSQHTFASESAAKAIADKYIRDNHIDSDMVAYTYGYKVPNQQFFVPVIKWKSDAEYANAKHVSAGNYVNSLTNSEVESEVLRLSTDEEMFDSTFTFNDGTTIDTPFELNDQQKIALQKLDDFANDRSKTAITLSGYAGTGKTSLMEMVAQKLRRRHNVVFSATTHQAAGVLKSKVGKYGFDTRTVNSLFGINVSTDLTGKNYDTRKKVRNYGDDKLQYGDIVIIDEASMLSDENYNDVVDIAKNRNAKVIFVGDKAQLAPVGQNEVSKVFRNVNGEVVELTKVERTGDNAILSEATAIRNGQNFTYESAFNAQGQGVAYVTPQSTEVISSIIETFTPGLKTNPNYLRILAFTNASVANYNNKVRQFLGYNGLPPQVGEPMLGYANWGYDRFGAAIGEPYKFVNSCSYKVIATQASYKGSVRLSDGTVCLFDILPLRLENSMGEQVTVPFIDIKNNVQNRNSAKLVAQEKEVLRVKAQAAKGVQKAKLWDAINDLENFLFVNDEIIGSQNNRLQDKVIDFGYAHTIHKSQGGTYTHIIMDDGGIEGSRSSAEIKQQLKYVGVSRATDTVTIISPQTKKADSPINHMQVGPEEVNNSNIAPTRPQNTQTESINIFDSTGENAHLSNFAIRPFTHTWGNGNTMQMQSVEQAFQIAKAATAKDTESIRKMQQTTDGATLRKLGRAVKGLDVAQWDANKANWMKVFIKESFMQNPKALEQLLATDNATLTHNQDKSTWGQMFPQILMQVREELRNYTPEEHPIRQTLVEQFSNYFGDGIEALHKDYPGISQEMLDKFEELAYTDADMTEADAKRFLEEAKNKSTLKETKSTIAEFENSPKPEANNTKEQRAPEVFNDNKTSVDVVSSNKTILSNEELQQWNEAGLGKKPRILVASEHTDPVFHVNKILDILEGKSSVNEWGIVNGKRQIVGKVSGKDFAGLYLVTKHDGLPMKRILETKIPKLIHFSITSLGGTKYEPGVMKANDLLDRIGEYIKQGLDPKSITIRIDPIVPGVTTKEEIENIVKRASEMGIRRIRFSIMDAYPNTQLAMEKLGYDFSQYYTRKTDGKYNFFANTSYIEDMCNFMLSLKDKYGVTLGTCAEAIAKNGISKEGCLSVSSVNEMLGTSIEDKGTANNEQRKLCSCYGGKIDALQYNSHCASHCVYCYAKHENDTAMQYYNEDGTLKDNDFTRTSSISSTLQDPRVSLAEHAPSQQGSTNMLPHISPNDIDTTTPKNQIPNPNPDGPLKEFTLHSGGAIGADFAWGNIGASYGVSGKHYFDATDTREGKRPPYGNTPITDEERTLGKRKAFHAGKTMGRLSSKAQKITDPLLIRDWLQVQNSDMVVAIAQKFDKPGDKFSNRADDERKALIPQVSGGTGWAVQMAINEGIPVFIFSQEDKTWRLIDNFGVWHYAEAPVLSMNFAGIGTRGLNADGEAAIRECYEKTVASLNSQTSIPTVEDIAEQAKKPFDIDSLPENMREDFKKQIARDQQINNILSSREMTSIEAREIVDSLMNRLSDYISEIINDPSLTNTSLKESDYNAWLNTLLVAQTRGIQEVVKPFDPTGMSRLDIINKIGIDNLVQQFLKKEVLTAKRTTTRPQAKKMRVFSQNLDALLYLGANTLSINEGIHLTTTTRVNGKELKTVENNIVINPDINSASDTESIQENEGLLQEKWQIDSRTIDPVESMSQLVRNELFKLYQLDSNGNKITDGIGIYKRVPVQETTKQLLNWLQGCLTLKDVVARLKDKQTENPWVKQLIDILDVEALGENAGQHTDFQNSFFSVFNKHFQSYSATTITYDKDGVQHITRIPLNEKPFLKETLGQIKVNIASGIHPLFTANNGINQLAFENFKTVLDTLHTIRDNKIAKIGFDKMSGADRQLTFEAISQAASLLGYPTDATTLGNLLTGREIRNMITNLDNMYDDILANITNPNYEPLTFTKGENGKRGSGIRGSLSNFLEPLTKHLADITVSSTFDSGKMYQSYVTPSYMTKLMLKFSEKDPVKFNQFIQEEFGKYDWFRDTSIRDTKAGWRSGWLGILARDAAARKVFKHEAKLNYNKHNYMKNMTGNEYIMSLLSSFFSEGAGNGKDGAVAWYRIPILSNKPSEEYIRFYADMGQDYKEVISTKMAKVFNQELSRIQTVRMQNYDKSDPRFIKNFHENGKRFCFLDFMNVYLEGGTEANTELGKLLNAKLEGTNWDVANEPRLLDLAQQAIQANMQLRIDEILKDYENRGIMEIAENIDGIKQGFGKDNIAENIERFLWNDSYAATQILQLTVTDIAYYKDMEDLQKRIAQIHAPGIRGNAEAVDYEGNRVSDGLERTMYLKDFDKVKSNIIENVKIVFDRKLEELKNQPLENFSNTKLKTDEDVQRAAETKKQRIMIQEELYNSILKQFEEINVADAQGYSSPTSYRKKMFIFGKWSREAENIYQKLLTGNYNYHDLQVAFQPLKPFVYSQITKPTGLENGPLKSLKMPVQNKNSEYLLIMADAILQGENTGQPNLLRAIYEVMEESAKSSPTKGIDTVQFESTVKSGLMGRNDINRVLEGGKWNELIETKDPNTGKTVQRTRGEVAAKAYLQNNLYIKNEQGKVIGYNPTFVHEIPFEDYCIQQEVPEHFKDHDQQHGSQIRMITPSDLLSVDAYGKLVTYNVEGRELSAKEFREEYENTIADNIQQSIDELVKELHLDAANQVEKNIILSRMLQDEILSSPTRYGLDMFLACSLNPFTGEFRIPLGDPIQANRIEQLLNSIIKKRVNEQKIAGGPVVQVSNFGTSRRLNIRFKDKNGGLLKTREEFTKDWKPVELAKMDVKSLANKLMKEEKLSDTIALKEAKRRIEEAQSTPQQTADEAYEQYIKNNQGGIAYFEVFASIFNEEIFHRFADPDGTIDIATMEKVCPEALQMIGYRIPTEDKYSCAPIKIVGFLPREAGEGIMLPYDITLLTGSDFDIDKEYLMRKKIHIKPKPFNETFKIMFPEFLEAKKKESKLTRDFTKQEKTWLKIEFTNMLNSFIGTEKVDGEVMYDVHNYQREAMSSAIEKQMWDRFKLVGYKVSKANKGKLYRDNKIFDMTWEVLSHETTADKMLNPGGFEEQKFESYLIEAFRNGTYSWEEYNDLGKKKLQLKDGKLEPYNEQDIKDKKASTGIEALKKLSYNTKNLIFSDSQVQFYEQNNAASTILGMFAVQKIGHAVLESNGYQVDIEEACDIAEPFTILGKKFGGRMEFDPMIDDEGNVIGKTLGSHVAAAADAAKEPCMNLLNINSMTANVHSTLIRLGMPFRHASLFLAQPVIRELLDRYNKRNLTDFASLDTILNEYIQEFRNEGNMMDSAIEHEEITEEELIENLRANKPETNYKVATAFGKLQRLAYAIKGPTYLTRYNSISNAVGPLITDNIVTEFKTNYETAGLYDRHGNELTPEIVFADHPILRKFADAYKLANKIFEDFPTKSQAFSEVLESIPGSLQDKFLNDRELLNDLKDFFLSHILVDNRVVNENRAGYYIKEFSKEFAANGIKEKNLDNEFIQTIKIKQDKDTGEFSLELSTTGMEQKKKDRLSDSWYELYKKNQPLAMDLFNYCFFRGGIEFNPKTFMNLLPLAMREEIPGYKESFTNIPTESAKYILEQFLAHNTSNYKLFPIKEGEKDVIGGGIIIQDRNELSQYADTPSFRIKDSNNKWRYLLLDKATEDGLAYKEIIPLGDNGEYLEMSSTRVPNISIKEIYGTNRKSKKQDAPKQSEVADHNNRPMDDTNRGLVTQTPAQEKSKAEKVIQGIMNSKLGMRTPELAKKYLTANAIINAEGQVEISNSTVWKYISAAMESQGLKVDKNELKDVLDKLC